MSACGGDVRGLHVCPGSSSSWLRCDGRKPRLRLLLLHLWTYHARLTPWLYSARPRRYYLCCRQVWAKASGRNSAERVATDGPFHWIRGRPSHRFVHPEPSAAPIKKHVCEQNLPPGTTPTVIASREGVDDMSTWLLCLPLDPGPLFLRQATIKQPSGQPSGASMIANAIKAVQQRSSHFLAPNFVPRRFSPAKFEARRCTRVSENEPLS